MEISINVPSQWQIIRYLLNRPWRVVFDRPAIALVHITQDPATDRVARIEMIRWPFSSRLSEERP